MIHLMILAHTGIPYDVKLESKCRVTIIRIRNVLNMASKEAGTVPLNQRGSDPSIHLSIHV